jgi:molybdate transport system substrate-binding protein
MKSLLQCLLILVFVACGHAAEVRVSAAASLADALKEIGSAYETKSGDKLVFNLGASNMLARQIEEGAPVDIFFSADEAKMDGLAKKGLVVAETRRSRLSNALAVVVATDGAPAIMTPQDLAAAAVKRLALADPKAVPAGIYARQWLEKIGLWAAVESKVVPTENVRAALAAVEAGNAQAGVVYRTDAAISKKVRIAFVVPPEVGPPISYSVALLKDAKSPDAARRFLEHLGNAEAAGVFEKFGFIVLK